jgi:hypothetical protein
LEYQTNIAQKAEQKLEATVQYERQEHKKDMVLVAENVEKGRQEVRGLKKQVARSKIIRDWLSGW